MCMLTRFAKTLIVYINIVVRFVNQYKVVL